MIDLNIKKLKEQIKSLNLRRLFYNNKFLIGFSIFLSFVIWFSFSSNSTESVPVTISDIPVEINLSENAKQDGLRIFSGHDITARVEIKGNRLVVGRVTKNDIQITAPQAAGTIMSPGNYMLELSARKVGVLKDYEIVSDVKPSVITVMADRYREAEFDIETEINFTPKQDYFVGSTILSSNKVTLSGPETEIAKIKKVKIKSSLPGEISSQITLKLPIIMYDAYGQAITSETISSSVSEIEASIPVLMKKEVPIVPSFVNVPSGINFDKEYKDVIKIAPSKLEIAGPEDVISNMKNISLETVDFSAINLKSNKMNVPINLPQGCRSLNNIYSAELNFNSGWFREKNFNVNQLVFKNIPEGKTATAYNNNIAVTVVAPASDILLIKPSDITAQIDLADKSDISGTIELPIEFSVKSVSTAWVCGKHYVNINLS